MLRRNTVLLASFLALVCTSSAAQDQPDYFPLHYGNTWTYVHDAGLRYTPGTYCWVERDVPLTDYKRAEYVTVTVVEGMVVDAWYYPLVWDTYSNGKLYRKSDAGDVLQYANGDEWVLYDLSFEGGEQEEYSFVKVSPRGYQTVMDACREPHTIEVPAGRFDGYWYAMWVRADPLIHRWRMHLAPDVGLVYWSFWSDGGEYDTLSLLHATVNGTYYGPDTPARSSSWGKIKATF